MKLDFPMIPISLSIGEKDPAKPLALPTAPANPKETAIVCLSAALLFTSLAVIALATEK